MFTKTCRRCNTIKDSTEFYEAKTAGLGTCKECRKRLNRQYYLLHPEKRTAHNLKTKYNISLELRQRLFQVQKGLCAICNLPLDAKFGRTVTVDHDHSTGTVRGLLCVTCNTALGKFKDDLRILRNAISYLSNAATSSVISEDIPQG